MSKVLANNQEVDVGDGRLVLMTHQQGIKVKVPDALQVSHKETIAVVDSLNSKQWTHISTGELFKKYFHAGMNGDTKEGEEYYVPIPASIEDLKDADDGIKHICGMIILLVENSPVFTDKSNPRIFLKEIETHLHPRQQRYIVDMVLKIGQDLYGGWKEKENDTKTGS